MGLEEQQQPEWFTFVIEDNTLLTPWIYVLPDLVSQSLASLPLRYLRSLRLTLVPLFEAEWRDIFGRLEFLQSISFVNNYSNEIPVYFIYALSPVDNVLDPRPSVITFPALVSLSFDQPFDLAHFDLLCSALQTRKALGCPLESLVFEQALGIDEAHILEMRQRLELQYQVPEEGTEDEEKA
ncbi:hypothetical protein AX16_004664 [Volvariella volvacea WC 439]|nr:hypothetical protein AX16_004664 [Volvariella volvacea WC 439]